MGQFVKADNPTDSLAINSARMNSSEMRRQEQKQTRSTIHDAGLMILIESRSLLCNCLGSSIASGLDQDIALYGDVDAVIASNDPATLIVLCDFGNASTSSLQQQIATLVDAYREAPIVVLADQEDDVERIRVCITAGVRGYIPTTLSLEVVIEAIHLVKAGGTYIPSNSVLFPAAAPLRVTQNASASLLTERQTAVIEALRRGKANKIIAYELNMKESTVKVHVRNIMKKLNAKNRTEVAFLATEMFGDNGAGG